MATTRKAPGTPARTIRIGDEVWLPVLALAAWRRSSATAMVTGHLESELAAAEASGELAQALAWAKGARP